MSANTPRNVVGIARYHESDGINTWVRYVLYTDDGGTIPVAGQSDALDAVHERLKHGPSKGQPVTFPLTLKKNPPGGRDGF